MSQRFKISSCRHGINSGASNKKLDRRLLSKYFNLDSQKETLFARRHESEGRGFESQIGQKKISREIFVSVSDHLYEINYVH